MRFSIRSHRYPHSQYQTELKRNIVNSDLTRSPFFCVQLNWFSENLTVLILTEKSDLTRFN